MTLENTKRHIILNAGHYDDPDTPHFDDPGATTNQVREAVEVIKIRDRVSRLLRLARFSVSEVPDTLDLRESIDWANQKAPSLNDGLAIDIHLNYLSDQRARGTETFYGTSETSEEIASLLAKGTAEAMNIPNRGAKPDTQTAVGSLGWIRKTTMWATLVEICFLTNPEDMEVLHGEDGYEKAARGVVNGVCDIFGVPRLSEATDTAEEKADPIIITIDRYGESARYKCYPIK